MRINFIGERNRSLEGWKTKNPQQG